MAIPNKQDSNRTGLSIAEEESLRKLPDAAPGSGLGDGAVWFAQEPNEYEDFGSDLTLVARSPINPSRQEQKGGVVDLDADGGFNMDFTQGNCQRLLQGFFFADAHEKHKSAPFAGDANPIASVTAGEVSFSEDFAVPVPAGALVAFTGFASPVNNGVKAVTTGGVNDLAVAGMVDDASPVGATFEVVGHQFASGDASLTLVNGVSALASAAQDLRNLGLEVGEWIFVGGDAASDRFAKTFFARIKSISQGSIVFDKASIDVFAADAGAAKTIRVYFGTVFRNEKDPDLIKRRTYSIERTLGKDENGTQAEYLDGAVANEMNIAIPQASKLAADLSYVALDNAQRTGAEGLRPGVRVGTLGEALINTSSNVYRMKMNIIDPTTVTPTPLFAYITEGNININNNVTPDKAVGVLGGFDTSAGNFVVSGDITAYFSKVEAVRAVRNNADVTMDFIFSAKNAGFVFDIPLLALGGGRLEVTAGESINLPLEMSAAESPAGYTLLFCFFTYLPNVAMAK